MVKLYYGDCLEVLPTLEKESCDMAFNDLPYGTTACSWDSVIPFDKMWGALNPVMKEKAAKIFTGTEPFSSHLRLSNLKEFKYDWYWNKLSSTNYVNAKNKPMGTMEIVMIFSKGTCANRSNKKMLYNPQGLKPFEKISRNGNTKLGSMYYRPSTKDNSHYQKFTNYPKNLIQVPYVKNSTHHTQKPVALIEYLIKTYTEEGETIIDITAGSGSTGVATQQTNRNAILIEKTTLWYNVAVRRCKGEDHKSLKAYIKSMREKYGAKNADFETPLQFPKVVVVS